MVIVVCTAGRTTAVGTAAGTAAEEGAAADAAADAVADAAAGVETVTGATVGAAALSGELEERRTGSQINLCSPSNWILQSGVLSKR